MEDELQEEQQDPSKIPIWLDCDPGHDDACAILLAAYHPALCLLGISTVHGNASLDKCTHNALSVLEAIGKPQVPVFPGSAQPFCRTIHTAPDIHGASGLAGTSLLPQPTRSALTHCNAILEMRDALLAQPKGKAYVVATGPLTNVALLFAFCPDLASHIAGLSIMGGAVGSGFTDVSMGPSYLDSDGVSHNRCGNWTPFAEFNIWADAESARSVLSNPILKPKTTLIPLDLTHQAYATPEIQSMLLNHARPTRLRTMFNELLMFFAHTYAQVFGIKAGPPLHDPLAVAVLLDNHVETKVAIAFNDNGGERWDVDVILEGEQIGRTVATKSQTGKGIRIPRSLDLERFWHTLESCMAAADEATGFEMVN
ncbi:Uridine nucleosidase 1 [Elasticomyces elasticus]|uniref:Uridine nucleosidase 1 n=1 Tax=Exophiala sideris TaxID=1016849 RepID=A0ABR0J8G5_9EURO|nr:Uridine nucleosidase 1 [Elasticomyces elasticus]KAK5025571.1 Uridine nucleosidase 1 [Exophiala sideris]KAK5029844.1 Uridine nucleosidase 1 [Exophiala sideris]KAK5058395.1 Uridine nucleosidase 1 [Exophiala sideris]KAK5178632.1 Uridine nucleosidase 1 [Eurotiomycetes sp. CCFEE 6388]